MSSAAWLAAVVAVFAYVASSGIEVELPSGRRVAPAAAFAPGLIALTFVGYEVVSYPLLVALALVGESAMFWATKRRHLLRTVAVHAAALQLTLGAFVVGGVLGAASGLPESAGLLLGAGGGALVFFALDSAAVSGTGASMTSRLADIKSAWPLLIVVTSTAGLLVIAFPHLGWASYLLMFAPVLATRYEFNRYREAMDTYEQTIRAFADLIEGAGYVPGGHHERVSALSVAIGREVGLSTEQLRDLELVALIHDVGTVSLPDPVDVATTDRELIAQNGGVVLEETGRLARYAPALVEAASFGEGDSIFGRILRVANAYDELTGENEDRVGVIKRSRLGEDAEITDALGRVTKNA